MSDDKGERRPRFRARRTRRGAPCRNGTPCRWRRAARDAACALVLRAAEAEGLADAFDELFSPKRRTLSKVRGELVRGLEPLLPGYVIAVACPDDLDAVASALRRSPRFARLVGQGGAFVPLSDQEVAWICAFTQRGSRTVEMSEGFVEGGRVVVTAGPLVGKEALVRKVNHRKRTAEVEFSICGRRVTAKVGLNLVKKEKLRGERPREI